MSTEVTVTEAEEIPIEKAVEKSFLTQLEKLEITKQFLIDKKDECLQLKLNGQDKEAYTLIRETRLNMKARRVAIEKVCKKGREDATRTQKAWLAQEKEWVKIVGEGETYLENLEEEFEKEKERIAAEIKRNQEEQFIIRQADLTKMGATYQDGSFVLNDVSYEAILIKESDNDVWDIMKTKFNDQYLINEQKRLGEEKLKEEAAAELVRQQQLQEQKQKELEEREAAIKQKEQEEADRQKLIQQQAEEERKKKNKERLEKRANQLAALGMTFNFQYDAYVFQDVNVDNKTEICLLDDTQWDALVEKIKPAIEKRKEEAEQKRLADIEEQKKVAAAEAVKKEQDRVAEEKRKADEKKLQDEAKKAEEALKATDKTKWASVLKSVEAIQLPDMKHPAYKQKVVDARKLIAKIMDL